MSPTAAQRVWQQPILRHAILHHLDSPGLISALVLSREIFAEAVKPLYGRFVLSHLTLDKIWAKVLDPNRHLLYTEAIRTVTLVDLSSPLALSQILRRYPRVEHISAVAAGGFFNLVRSAKTGLLFHTISHVSPRTIATSDLDDPASSSAFASPVAGQWMIQAEHTRLASRLYIAADLDASTVDTLCRMWQADDAPGVLQGGISELVLTGRIDHAALLRIIDIVNRPASDSIDAPVLPFRLLVKKHEMAVEQVVDITSIQWRRIDELSLRTSEWSSAPPVELELFDLLSRVDPAMLGAYRELTLECTLDRARTHTATSNCPVYTDVESTVKPRVAHGHLVIVIYKPVDVPIPAPSVLAQHLLRAAGPSLRISLEVWRLAKAKGKFAGHSKQRDEGVTAMVRAEMMRVVAAARESRAPGWARVRKENGGGVLDEDVVATMTTGSCAAVSKVESGDEVQAQMQVRELGRETGDVETGDNLQTPDSGGDQTLVTNAIETEAELAASTTAAAGQCEPGVAHVEQLNTGAEPAAHGPQADGGSAGEVDRAVIRSETTAESTPLTSTDNASAEHEAIATDSLKPSPTPEIAGDTTGGSSDVSLDAAVKA